MNYGRLARALGPVLVRAGVLVVSLAACGDDASQSGPEGELEDPMPVVVGSEPSEGATGVDPDLTAIEVQFSEPMRDDVGEVDLTGPGAVVGFAWSSPTELRIDIESLVAGEAYGVQLAGFESAEGAPLEEGTYLGDGILDFSTAPDVAPIVGPQVVSSAPVEKQLDVPVDVGAIAIAFDRPMDPSAGTVLLVGAGVPVALMGTWNDDATELVLSLSSLTPLLYSTKYAARLDGFVDVDQVPLDLETYLGDGEIDFTTVDVNDANLPYAYQSDPVEGASDVYPSFGEIVLSFSESMDPSITTVDLSIGANTLELSGAWSLSDTRFTLDVPVELPAQIAYRLDLTTMRDASGNPLNPVHPYLGDGSLDFVVGIASGETCAETLVESMGVTVGGALTYVLPEQSVTAADGQFACDSTVFGPDAVIRYEKTSPSVAQGGLLLHVTADPEASSSSQYINLEILSGDCDPSVGVVETCLSYKDGWDTYLDVPAGTYWIYVAKHSSASASNPFPQTTVAIEEVAPAAGEGEGCFSPYSVSSAIHSGGGGSPHRFDVPASINALDGQLGTNGPGGISCDAGVQGVDAVIQFDKAQSGSIVTVSVDNVASSQSDLNVEVLTECDPTSPSNQSLFCRSNTDFEEFSVPGDAGSLFIWLSAENNIEEFGGATVFVDEFTPSLGESWGTPEPLTMSGPIAPTSARRLDPPSCFPSTGNIHWYEYPVVGGVVSVAGDAAAPIALWSPTGAELDCSTNAQSAPLSALVGAGTSVIIAVESPTTIGSLTIGDVDYEGVVGNITDLNIAWAPGFPATTDYELAISDTELYLQTTSGVHVVPKAGNATSVFHGSGDGIGTVHLGYDIAWAQGALFSVDTTTSTTNAHVYRLFDEPTMTWGPVAWDVPNVYPTNHAFNTITFDGSTLVMARKYSSGSVTFFSSDPLGPGSAIDLGTNDDVDDVVGMAADSQYFYVAGTGQNGEGEGVFRIDRADVTAPAVLVATLDLSSVHTSMCLDDLAQPTTLYVREYSPSRIHAVAQPASGAPAHVPDVVSLGTVNDYAMGCDPQTGDVYLFETQTLSVGRVVLIQ